MPLSNGQSLLGGNYTIKNGVAVLQFVNGVETIIEGPAQFYIQSDKLLILNQGRILAHVPNGAHGFTIKTPTTTTIDLGTDFGVDVNKELQTEVHVIKGEVEFNDTPEIESATSVDTRRLLAGQAVRMNKLSLWVAPIKAKPILFINKEDVDVLERAANGDENAKYQALMRDLMRKPGLLAASTATPRDIENDQIIDGFGFKKNATWRTYNGSNTKSKFAKDTLHTPYTNAYGKSLILSDKTERQDVFMDLDTSQTGPFALAGLINSQKMIGKDNTTIYLSWLTQNNSTTAQGFAGLALFSGSDNLENDEMLFVGKVSNYRTYSYVLHRAKKGSTIYSDLDKSTFKLDQNPQTILNDDYIVDTQTHRWVMRIDFKKGNDKIQIYIDPSQNNSEKANGITQSMDLSFDRIRFAIGQGAYTWKFDEIRIGTTLESVTYQEKNKY